MDTVLAGDTVSISGDKGARDLELTVSQISPGPWPGRVMLVGEAIFSHFIFNLWGKEWQNFLFYLQNVIPSILLHQQDSTFSLASPRESPIHLFTGFLKGSSSTASGSAREETTGLPLTTSGTCKHVNEGIRTKPKTPNF